MITSPPPNVMVDGYHTTVDSHFPEFTSQGRLRVDMSPDYCASVHLRILEEGQGMRVTYLWSDCSLGKFSNQHICTIMTLWNVVLLSDWLLGMQ